MVSFSLGLEIALALYLIMGSTSWGYVFLRAGWPRVRALKPEYRGGWSLVFGVIFGAAIVTVSFIIFFLKLTPMTFTELVMVDTIVLLSTGSIIFTVKRKLLGTKQSKFSVPKRAVTANIVAQKAFQKIPSDNYIKVSSMTPTKLSEAKEKLAAMESTSMQELSVTGEVGEAEEAKARASELKNKLVASKPPEPEIPAETPEKKTGKADEKQKRQELGKELASASKPSEVVMKAQAREPAYDKRPAKTRKEPEKEQLKKPEKGPGKKWMFQKLSLFEPGYSAKAGKTGMETDGKAKRVDDIMAAIDNKHERDKNPILTREQMQKKIDKSKLYIRQSIREQIGPELDEEKPKPEPKPVDKTERALPRSASMLKQLLRDKK